MPEKVKITVERMNGQEQQTVNLERGDKHELTLDNAVITIEPATYAPPDFWTKRPTDPRDLERRLQKGQEQQEIAEDLGVSPSTVSRWINRIEALDS